MEKTKTSFIRKCTVYHASKPELPTRNCSANYANAVCVLYVYDAHCTAQSLFVFALIKHYFFFLRIFDEQGTDKKMFKWPQMWCFSTASHSLYMDCTFFGLQRSVTFYDNNKESRHTDRFLSFYLRCRKNVHFSSTLLQNSHFLTTLIFHHFRV